MDQAIRRHTVGDLLRRTAARSPAREAVRYEETAWTYAEFDPSQVGQNRLSAVQYLVFTLPAGPVGLGSDFAALELSVDLDEVQQAALAADLAATIG